MKNENIIYDETEIKIEKVNKEIVFIIENKTDETIFILFEDEYDYLNQEPLEIYPYNTLCFLADGIENIDSSKTSEYDFIITGNMANTYLQAFENYKFLTINEDTYKAECEGDSDE